MLNLKEVLLMQLSYKDKSHNKVDYFVLPNGYADVFLHKNEVEEIDSEGNKQYVAEEVYFQIEQSITKEQIESEFDLMWEDVNRDVVAPPTTEERLQMAEDTLLFLLMGGI